MAVKAPYMDRVRTEIDAMAGDDSWLLVYGPRETVRQNMATAQVKVTSAEVDKLWEAYRAAQVEEGLPVYAGPSGSGPLVAFMVKHTGYPVNAVAAYLNALLQAVKFQGWDSKWIDPRMGIEKGKAMDMAAGIKDKAKELGDAVGGFLKPTLDPVTNLVKYAAIAVVAGAVIYGIYHGTKIFKSAKRRRKA